MSYALLPEITAHPNHLIRPLCVITLLKYQTKIQIVVLTPRVLAFKPIAESIYPELDRS